MQKFLRTMLLMACLIVPWATNAQETLTVNDGTATNGKIPVNGLYTDTQGTTSEFVISATTEGMDDLVGATITKLTFYVPTPPASWGTPTIQLYMGEVDYTTLSSLNGPTDFTVVATGVWDNTQTTIEVEFDEPYIYEGGNLLIGTYVQTAGGYKTTNFAGVTAESGASRYNNGSGSGTAQSFLPKVTFTYEPGGNQGPTCTKPNALTVANILNNEATMSWNERGEATTWQLCINDDEDNIIDVTSTTYTLTELTPLTTYTVKVRAYCSDDLQSDWTSNVSFTTTAVAEVVGDAWSDDFEADACGWELINGTLTNTWAWGTAINNGGTHALYISNDGGTTNAYTVSGATMVYATKLLTFAEGKYEFTYDWTGNGESNYDYLRVALVPSSTTLTAGTSLPSGLSTTAVPTGWIALDGGSKLNLATAWQSNSVAVNITAGNYYLVLAWRNDNSSGTNPPAAIDNVSITRFACAFDVADLTANNITASSSTITWTAGDAEQWQVVYSDNSNFENATEEIVNAATYAIDGLQSNTSYHVKVRAYCGGEDFGSWSATVSFHTACAAISELPYTEGFEEVPTGSYQIPYCLTRINDATGSSNYYPYSYTSYPHTGSRSLYFYSYTGSSYATNQAIVLPQIDNNVIPLSTLRLRFYARGSSSSGGTLSIGTISDPTDIATFTEVQTVDVPSGSAYPDDPFTITGFPDNGDQYIAILMVRGESTQYAYVDDVTLDLIPNCPDLTGLAVSDIAANEATLTWGDNGSAGYVVYDAESNVIATVSENSYALTDLEPTTNYTFGVASSCGDEQGTIATVSFRTTGVPTTTPYVTGFEDGEDTGWEFVQGTVNMWAIGAATGNESSNSLYISNDGGTTNAYTNNSLAVSYAYRALQIDQPGDYTVSFDWMAVGEGNYDYIRAWIAPADFAFTANKLPNGNTSTSGYTSTTPDGWIALGGKLNQQSTWQNYEDIVAIAETGNYRLVFMWCNDNSGGSNPAATVDNVNVTRIACSAITGLTASDITAESLTLSWTDNKNEGATYTVTYGEESVTAQGTTVTIEGLEPETEYTFSVVANCNADASSTAVAVTATTLASCAPATQFAVSDITAYGATFTWSSNAELYTLYIVTPEGEDNTVIATTTELSYTVAEDLQPNTQYTIGVVASCGDVVTEMATVTFRTLCAPYSVDAENAFAEDFSNLASGIPGCWDNAEGTTTNSGYRWNYYATGHEGAGLRFNSYNNSSNNTNFLATPSLQLNVTPRLSFWYKNPTGGDFTVMVSTDGGTTRETLASGLTGVSQWTLFEMNLGDEYNGQTVIFYFKGTSNYGNGDAYIYLDDVIVDKAPTCLPVTELTASDITTESLTLTWTDAINSGATYTVTYGEETLNVEGTTVTIEGLESETEYTFTVVANCDADDASTAVEVTATTLPSCAPAANLAASEITANGAVLTWTSNAENYTIYNMADESVLATTTDLTYTLAGLAANTQYTFGVQAHCGDEVASMTTVTFRTACGAVVLPFTEGFEDGVDCWTVDGVSGTGITSSNAYEGTKCFKFQYSTNPPQYLISPEIESAETGVEVNFMYRINLTNYPESFALGYSTTTADISAFTWGEEQTNLTNTEYLAYSEVMPEGTKYVAVKYTSDDMYNLFIDNFTLDVPSNQSEEQTVTITACESYTWDVNGQTYTENYSGEYLDEVNNITYLLNITIYHGGQTNTTIENYEEGTPVEWNGSTYTAAGTYTYTYGMEQYGCELTDTLVLLPAAVQPVYYTVTTYHWPGGTVTGGGQYAAGSVATLVATPDDDHVFRYWTDGSTDQTHQIVVNNDIIVQAYFEAVGAEPCNTVSGIVVMPASDNSASVMWTPGNDDDWLWHILVSYVGSPTTLVFQAVTQNPYEITGLEPGIEYSIGVATICTHDPDNHYFDTTRHIFTTYTPAAAPVVDPEEVNVEATESACDSSFWTVNGQTYTESGTYTYDSLDTDANILYHYTLNLTIKTAEPTEQTVEAEGSYEWQDVTYTESGDYTGFYRAENGCQGIVTLHLTITPGQEPSDLSTLTVNDGTSTNSIVPIYGNWCDDYSKSQFIIPAEELDAMQWGSVNKLTFYSSNTTKSWGNASFKVYMTMSDETTLSALADWETMEQVYEGSLSINDNIMEVTFVSPFQYTGGNLLVGIDQTVSGSYSSCSWYGVSTTSGSSWGGYGTSVNAQSFLPKTTFHYTPGEAPAYVCNRPTTFEVSDITAHEATFAWEGDAAEYTLEYKTTDADEWTVVEEITANSYTLENLDQNTSYNARVKAVCAEYDMESSYRTASFTTLISCPAPTALAVTLTPGNGSVAELSWTAGDEETEWQICLNDDEENLIVVSGNPATLTDLTAEQAYTAKVRAYCDEVDQSAWSAAVSFTPTDAYSITVNDGTNTNSYVPVYGLYVDELTKSQFVIPAETLADIQYGTVSKMVFYSNTVSAGWDGAEFNVYLAEADETTLTALADLEGMDQVYAGSLSIVDNVMEVTLSTPYQYMGGNLLVGFNQTAEGTYKSCNWYGASATSGSSWGGYGTSVNAQAFLPKTTFYYTPGEAPAYTCDRPTTFEVSDITAHEATFAWEGEAAEYALEYKAADEEEWTVVEEITANSYTLEDLDQNTSYNARVKAVCAEYDMESGYKTVNFTTLLACPAPTALAVTLTPGDATTAMLTWNAGGQETEWQLCLDGNEDNLFTSNDTFYIFPGLTPEQIYTAKVRAYCDEVDQSEWSDEVTFQPTEKLVIGSGTATNGNLPLNNYYNYSLTEQIYTAAELGEAGTILSIDFYKASDNAAAKTLDIYMVSTEKSEFSSNTDWIAVTAADLVYSGTVTFEDNAWTTVELANPFFYDGESNVAIVVDNNTGAYESNTPFLVFATNPSANQAIYYCSDSDNSDPTASLTTTGTRSTSKNQIRIMKGELPDCVRPTQVAVNYNGGTTAEVTWTSDADAVNIEVNGVVTGNVTSPYTLSDLELATAYEVRVQAVCDITTSDWTIPVSFNTDLCMPENQCQVTIVGRDQYTDGWNGASLEIVQNEVTIGTFTIATGNSGTAVYDVCAGVPVSFNWTRGSYPNECSFDVQNAEGTVFSVAQGNAPAAGLVYTLESPCPTCFAVTGLAAAEVTAESVTLTWTDTVNGAASYTVSYGDSIMAVEGTTTTITGLEPATEYMFSVVTNCSADDASIAATVSVTTLASCSPAVDLAVSDITANSATLTWYGNAALYNIYSIVDGDSVQVGSTEDNSYTLTGLDALTPYTIAVQGVCDDVLTDFSEVGFNTDCGNGNCNITIVGHDSYGDGWNGNYIDLFQNGVMVDEFTLENGGKTEPVSETFSVCAGMPIDFLWKAGSYANEASFEILNSNGDEVYTQSSGSNLTTGVVFYTMSSCDAEPPMNYDTISSTESACDSYVWYYTGESYSTSGVYTHDTLIDNTNYHYVLNLTINHGTNTEESIEAEESYDWYGDTLTVSGDYLHTYTDENNCESTVTLHLTIIGGSDTNISDTTVVVEDATITTGEIIYWVGEGPNKAIMAVNWADTALAWGYHWSGEATVGDMMNAIAEADPRFSIVNGDWGIDNILFNDGTVNLTAASDDYWWINVNGSSDNAGLSQTIATYDFIKWGVNSVGVVIDSTYWEGYGWYASAMAFPVTIYPVSIPETDTTIVEPGICADPDVTYQSTTSNSFTVTWTSGDNNSYWEVILFTSIDSSDNQYTQSDVYTTTENTYTFYDLAPSTTHVIAIRGICGITGDTSEWVEAWMITKPACGAPEFIVDEVTSNSISLSWEPGDNNNYWEVVFADPDDTMATVYPTYDSAYTFSDLTPNTTYLIGLRARCGAWAEPTAWTTTNITTLTDSIVEPATATISATYDATLGTVIGTGVYNIGETATLIAVPNMGVTFNGWSNGGNNPMEIEVTEDMTFTANFVAGCDPVHDTVAIHDTTVLAPDTIYITLTDTVVNTEYVYDTVTNTEYVHDTVYMQVLVHDTTFVTEFDSVDVTIYVHDTTVVTEYVEFTVHDTTYITLTDTVVNTEYVYDTVTNTEYVYDTVEVEVPVHDTTIVTLTDTVVNTEYVYDTVTNTEYVYDTVEVEVPVHDTTYLQVLVHDTTYVTLTDTVIETEYVYDTTYITLTDTVVETEYVHDTTIVNNYIHDTTYVDIHDSVDVTVYVHDTAYVEVPVHDTTVVTEWYEVLVHDTLFVTEYDTITDTVTNTEYVDVTVYDTILLTDTVVMTDTVEVEVPVHDTTFVNNYIHDTTYVDIHDSVDVTVYVHDTVTEFVEVPVHDTTVVTEWYEVLVHDTTFVTLTDTVTNTEYVYDTVNNYIYDTVVNTEYVYDTVTNTEYIYDTVTNTEYVYDTVTNTEYVEVPVYITDTVTNTEYVEVPVYITDTVEVEVPVYDTVTNTEYVYDTVTNTEYVYDTVTTTEYIEVPVYDTIVNTVYDTVVNTEYVYDTVTNTEYVYDTVTNTEFVMIEVPVYDTTVIVHYDTVVSVEYIYDTVTNTEYVYDTVTNTEYVYDTVVNTEYVYDTVTNTEYVYDTVTNTEYIYDTVTNTEYIYDTVTNTEYVYDTVTNTEYIYDTVTNTEYIYDTVINTVYDTVTNHDTITNTEYVEVYDTIENYIYDTINHYIYDTASMTGFVITYVTNYIDSVQNAGGYFDPITLGILMNYLNSYVDTVYADTLYVYDTVYIHDTVYVSDGIDDVVETAHIRLFQRDGNIVVEDADGGLLPEVRVYDAVGRQMEAGQANRQSSYQFRVPASGAYLVKVGDRPARRIVVVK